MDDKERQQNVTPEPRKQESQDPERLPVTAEPVKNVLVALGLALPLPVSAERSWEDIEEALRAPERADRVAAAHMIGEQRGPLLLPIVLNALRHEDQAVRAAIVGVIGQLKEKVPLDLLLEALQDVSWYVRACAVHELGCQIERAPILPLIESLHDEDESVRAEAVWALSRFQEHAPDILLDALHDSSWLVREAAEEFMKERLEQAFQASSKESYGELFSPNAGANLIPFPQEPFAEAQPPSDQRLPITGPLPQHILERRSAVYERRRSVRQALKENETGQRVSRRPQKPARSTSQWGPWLGRALVALLILGFGLSWSTLVQRFHQSAVTSQGSLSCVFNPGSTRSGNTMAWASRAPGSALFAVAGARGTVESYDVNSCGHVAEYKQEAGSSVLALKWASDGLRVVNLTASGVIEVLLESNSGQHQLLLAIAAAAKTSQPLAVWSENGQYLAVNRGDSRVEIWNVQDGKLIASYTSPYGILNALAWSPDNSEIAVASAFDNQSKAASIQIWSLLTRSTTSADIHTSAEVAAMAWSEDGENLLIYDQNAVVNKWSRQTQNYNSLNPGVYASLQRLPDGKLALAYAPDSRRYAISSAGEIQIWNAVSAQQLGIVSDGLSEIEQLSWSDDGEHIAASSRDGTVQVWRVVG